MPISSVTADDALTKMRRRRSSRWPERWRGADRLKGVASVEFDPTFVLEPGEAVMTIGSCFARNIEARLKELGFRVPARDISLPAEERSSDTPNDLLNKYTPHSIINELRWAFEPELYPFPEEALLQTQDLWHDPHLAPNVKPSSLERVRERREMITGLYRQLPDCRVVVLTLGLVEVWLDTRTGLYLNGAPPVPSVKLEPDRFRLEVLTHAEILAALETIHGLLKAHGHPEMKLLITVSPVPMKASFSGSDALIANTYSKSTLRSAVGEFVNGRAGVDYFPSYEIATLTLRTTAFQEDNRHVAPALVNAIVDRVASAYCEGSAAPAASDGTAADAEFEGMTLQQAGGKLREAMRTNDVASALRLFAFLDEKDRYKRAKFNEYNFRKAYGMALVEAELDIQALGQIERAVVEMPTSPYILYELANVQSRLQRPREAAASYRAALALDPDNTKYRQRLAAKLMDSRAYEEAIVELEHLRVVEPKDKRIIKMLEVSNLRASEAAAAAESQGAVGGVAEAAGASEGLWRRLTRRIGG